jgi:hypothetical protein
MVRSYLAAFLSGTKTRVTFVVIFSFIFLTLSTSFAPAQSSARIVQRTLDQLIDEADVIVHGHVLSARLEPHPQLHNLMTVVVTMNVQDTYKGKPASSLTFRQYVWNTSGGSSGYRKGQEMVLLLRPVSEYGLTSPAGLEQGRFQVMQQPKGKTIAVNGQGNFQLFSHLEELARSRGVQLSPHLSGVIRKGQARQMSLDDLAEVIRTFARTR